MSQISKMSLHSSKEKVEQKLCESIALEMSVQKSVQELFEAIR